LIDYGSTRSPRKGRAKSRMRDVAPLIEQHTNGVLDVLAVTHRHKDHLFGFADTTGAATMRRLKPPLVLRPWTEDPTLQPDATGPRHSGDPLLGQASASFAAGLANAQTALHHLSEMPGLHPSVVAAVAGQVRNAEAIDLLDELSEADQGRYLFAGCDPGTTDAIPGMAITVLGPPTVEQDRRVARQRSDDKDEFWMLRLSASLEAAAGQYETDDVVSDVDLGPGPVRWLVDRLAAQRSHSTVRLVRQLDDALNNTSLSLLLEIGSLKLLFPGDAQIENWQHTLDRLPTEPELRAKLRDVDLYKVGHHGSRNATPRSLHAIWQERPSHLPMTILMSTRDGVHGDTPATRVPRQTLIDALKELGPLFSTDDLDQGQVYLEFEADAQGGPFRP